MGIPHDFFLTLPFVVGIFNVSYVVWSALIFVYAYGPLSQLVFNLTFNPEVDGYSILIQNVCVCG